jgi:hypothetical protein
MDESSSDPMVTVEVRVLQVGNFRSYRESTWPVSCRRLVPDLQSPVLQGAGDPDPRSASVEALRGLVDRLFPDRAQVVDVDNGIDGQRDPCPTEAELQLDVDHRALEDPSPNWLAN